MIIGFLFSCKKENTSSFVLYPDASLNDTNWSNIAINKPLQDSCIKALRKPIFIDSFNARSGGDIDFKNDIIGLHFDPNSIIDPTNNTIINKGMVRVELELLLGKGDNIRNLNPSSINDSTLLNSHISVSIKLKKNGYEVLIAPLKLYHILFRTNNTFIPRLFIGNLNNINDSTFSWKPASSLDGVINYVKGGGGSKPFYDIATTKLHWLNCSSVNSVGISTARLNVTMPPNYTNKNTLVFSVLNNSNTVIPLIPDIQNKVFFSNKIPLNNNLTILSISKIDNDYFLGHIGTTFTNGNRIFVNPVKISISAISNYLDSL